MSALFQTQQAVLQQGIRNQVVVILDLSLTVDSVKTQQLQYVWRWSQYEQRFLSTVVLFMFQNRSALQDTRAYLVFWVVHVFAH